MPRKSINEKFLIKVNEDLKEINRTLQETNEELIAKIAFIEAQLQEKLDG